MNILVINVYSWNNKGDAAILTITVEMLRRCFPNCHINVISMTPELDSSKYKPYELTFIESPVLAGLYERGKLRKVTTIIRYMLLTIIWGGLLRLFGIGSKIPLPRSFRAMFNSYVRADLVISCGGGYLNDSFGSSFFINLFHIWLGQILHKRILLLSQSIGPFRSSVHSFVTRMVINRTQAIILREEISRSSLEKMQVTKPSIFVLPDISFLLIPVNVKRARQILKDHGVCRKGKWLIGVTARKWSYPGAGDPLNQHKQYIRAIADTLDYFIKWFNAFVVFIPQVIGPGDDDDRFVAREIRDIMQQKNNVKLIEMDYSPEEIKGVIGQMDVFIGTRMHSNVFAMSMRIPTIAISYEYKTEGIMRMMKMQDWVIPIQNLSSKSLIVKTTALRLQKNTIRKALTNAKSIWARADYSAKVVKDVASSQRVQYSLTHQINEIMIVSLHNVRTSRRLRLNLLRILCLGLAMSGLFAYNVSSLVARFTLITTFMTILTTTILAHYWSEEKTVYSMFFIACLISLLWGSTFISPQYIESILNSDSYVFAQQYAEKGHLVYSVAHSYFFLSYLVLHCLYELCGFPPLVSIYISLVIYDILLSVLGILLFRTIKRRTVEYTNAIVKYVIPPLAPFLLIFNFGRVSTAGGYGWLPEFLVILVVYILFDRWFKDRRYSIITLFLITGVTLGTTDGILLIIPLFSFLSISRIKRTVIPYIRRTVILYALIPLGYMIFAGYSYIISLKTYATFAIGGFIEFLVKAITNEPVIRVIPWERTSTLIKEDVFVASITYLSLMILSTIIAFVSTYCIIKEKNERDIPYILIISSVAYLWIALVVATIAYIGASTMPEVPFSDIRTIIFFLISLLIPFQFVSKRLLTKISITKYLPSILISLMFIASLRTLYGIYPKSFIDPRNVVEDVRADSINFILMRTYINSYYKTGGIIADYAVYIKINKLLPYPEYEMRLLNESTFEETFDDLSHRSYLIFDIEGIKYNSIYISPKAYLLAYNFSLLHNRLYDSGVIRVISHRD